MNPKVDLKELASRESEQVEWKRNVAEIDDVVRTVAAFANDFQNLGGGTSFVVPKNSKTSTGFKRLLVRD